VGGAAGSVGRRNWHSAGGSCADVPRRPATAKASRSTQSAWSNVPPHLPHPPPTAVPSSSDATTSTDDSPADSSSSSSSSAADGSEAPAADGPAADGPPGPPPRPGVLLGTIIRDVLTGVSGAGGGPGVRQGVSATGGPNPKIEVVLGPELSLVVSSNNGGACTISGTRECVRPGGRAGRFPTPKLPRKPQPCRVPTSKHPPPTAAADRPQPGLSVTGAEYNPGGTLAAKGLDLTLSNNVRAPRPATGPGHPALLDPALLFTLPVTLARWFACRLLDGPGRPAD
jgi:hypothetical protein